MVRLTRVVLALSATFSLAVSSSVQAREARLAARQCNGQISAGSATQTCILYGLNCDCAETGTPACAEGYQCYGEQGSGHSGGGGSIPAPAGTGACPDCGTGNVGGTNNVSPPDPGISTGDEGSGGAGGEGGEGGGEGGDD